MLYKIRYTTWEENTTGQQILLTNLYGHVWTDYNYGIIIKPINLIYDENEDPFANLVGKPIGTECYIKNHKWHIIHFEKKMNN